MLHRRGPSQSPETSSTSSCRRSWKRASIAGGLARTTNPSSAWGICRQICRSRLFNLLRRTALPSFRRTTKTIPRGSRPRRIHSRGPRIQSIGENRWKEEAPKPAPLSVKTHHTARRLRPRRRRRLMMFRPEGVLMRWRKPCLLRRFLLLG